MTFDVFDFQCVNGTWVSLTSEYFDDDAVITGGLVVIEGNDNNLRVATFTCIHEI